MGNNPSVDTQRYLDGYPGEPDDKSQCKNIDFYSNKRPSKPDGDTIENIHKKWFGNYGLLESHHGYVQWLFPIREDGLNHSAQRLQLHEAKAIASDSELQGRVITSYELMLDFYGMKLVSRTEGTITRAENWKVRYAHLNRSFHNYLRITRIIKCLGEIGLEHFKIHFVKHVLQEIYENKELLNCHESCIKYWAAVLRKEEDRNVVEELIDKYEASRPARRATIAHSSSDDDDRKRSTDSLKKSASELSLTKQNGNHSPKNSESEDSDENESEDSEDEIDNKPKKEETKKE